MATPSPFERVRIDAAGQRRSMTWYRNQVQRLQDLNRGVNRELTRGRDLRNNVFIGDLYLFRYDPKHKATLPYYDTLPLVMPFNRAEGGFLGINLHYLPYGMRFKVMGALLDQVTNVSDPYARAKISYAILNNASRFPGVQHCVKHYLINHVQGRFLQIPNDEWLAAAMMPIEQFHGAPKSRVFQNARI